MVAAWGDSMECGNNGMFPIATSKLNTKSIRPTANGAQNMHI